MTNDTKAPEIDKIYLDCSETDFLNPVLAQAMMNRRNSWLFNNLKRLAIAALKYAWSHLQSALRSRSHTG